MEKLKMQGEKRSAAQGETYGRWQLEEKLGRGGNGEVWRAKSIEGLVGAVKLLTKIKPGAYKRFKDEVSALERSKGIPGVLPIYASYLPPTSDKRNAWYVCPLGLPLETWAISATAIDKVMAIAEVACTMAQLHHKQLAHRDLKSANLVMYKNRCHVVDFGLVTYPGKQDLTGRHEDIGPKWTMAPEVRRFGTAADPFKADVYSLAKTLWSILKGDFKGFEGQYSPETSISIESFFQNLHVTPLEETLRSATSHVPGDRPSMYHFAEALIEWLVKGNEFMRINQVQWQEALKKIFPVAMPKRAEWTKSEDIVTVLSNIAKPGLNHLFYPTGGGNDLVGVVNSPSERGSIELLAGGSRALIKPVRLHFEALSTMCEWNYFRLEAEKVWPRFAKSGSEENLPLRESMVRVGREDLDVDTADRRSVEDFYEDESAERILIDRWLGGVFVIFQKSSFYNLAPYPLDAYDGRHNSKTVDEFRAHVIGMRDLVISEKIDLKRGRYSKNVAHPAALLSKELIGLGPEWDDEEAYR